MIFIFNSIFTQGTIIIIINTCIQFHYCETLSWMQRGFDIVNIYKKNTSKNLIYTALIRNDPPKPIKL